MSKQKRLIIGDVAQQFTDETLYIYKQCGFNNLDVSHKVYDTPIPRFEIITEDKSLNLRFWYNVDFEVACITLKDETALSKIHTMALDSMRFYTNLKNDITLCGASFGMIRTIGGR